LYWSYRYVSFRAQRNGSCHETRTGEKAKIREEPLRHEAIAGLMAGQLAALAASRVTRDVDARFLPHGIVLEEARRVADDLGCLPGG
jgi:hypothetical protein